MIKNNSKDSDEIVKILSLVQINAAKWGYMKWNGALDENEAAAKLFADRQTKAAQIEALLRKGKS